MKNRIFLSLIVVCWVVGGTSAAENTRPKETPKIVQIEAGPNNIGLPNFGRDYCGPTTLTMNLFWLKAQGFPEVAPEFNTANAYSLVRVMAGFSHTTPFGGADDQDLFDGCRLYLSLKGFAGTIQTETINAPTETDLASYFTGFNMLATCIGWYEKTNGKYARNGGHYVALLKYKAGSKVATINNSAPSTLFPVPGIPSEVRQFPAIGIVPSGTIPGLNGPYLQYVTPTLPGLPPKDELAVIGQLLRINVTATPGAPQATFDLDKTVEMNTNGGSMVATTTLAGAGGIDKQGDGVLLLTQANTTTGANFVAGGVLSSAFVPLGGETGAPFGSGSVTLTNGGQLAVSPAGSLAAGNDIQLTAAAGAGRQLKVIGQGSISLDRGKNNSLTLTVGGIQSGTERNLILTDFGTLTLVSANGVKELGSRVKLLVNGETENTPPSQYGMLSPGFVALDSGANADGSFVRYHPKRGMELANPTRGASFSGTDSKTPFATTAPIDLGASTATVASLTANYAITGTPGAALRIKPAGATEAGLILNGAVLSLPVLDFGQRDGYIYSNRQGGRINSDVKITGSLVTFGPGRTDFFGERPQLRFCVVYVNDGTLNLRNGGVDGAPVNVRSGAQLVVGPGRRSIAGAVNVLRGGLVTLKHGTLSSGLNMETTATLRGTGKIRYTKDFTLQGTLGDGKEIGILTFKGSSGATVTVDGADTLFEWTLKDLTDVAGRGGIDWNVIKFATTAVIGTAAHPLGLNLGFAEGLKPDPKNPFWQKFHQWTLFEFGDPSNPTPIIALPNNNYQETAGKFSTVYRDQKLILQFDPIGSVDR